MNRFQFSNVGYYSKHVTVSDSTKIILSRNNSDIEIHFNFNENYNELSLTLIFPKGIKKEIKFDQLAKELSE